MGRRSEFETIAAVAMAFVRRRRWPQAELARELAVGTVTIRRTLRHMQEAGWPFESHPQHPHVIWEAPKGWLPGALSLDPTETLALIHLLARVGSSPHRDQLLRRVASVMPTGQTAGRIARVTVAPTLSDEQEQLHALFAHAAAEGRVVKLKYFSPRRPDVDWREISPHRVVPGPPAFVLATCHRDGRLKRFNLDRVQNTKLLGPVSYRPIEEGVLTEWLTSSARGFREPGDPVAITFEVRSDCWQQMRDGLPGRVDGSDERANGWTRVRARTGATKLWGLYLLGWGARVRVPLGDPLRDAMEDIVREGTEALREGPADDGAKPDVQ